VNHLCIKDLEKFNPEVRDSSLFRVARLHKFSDYQLGGLGDPVSPEEIRTLFRGARRYQFGAAQDRNPIVAFLHNSYAVAYLAAMRDIATDEEIEVAISGELGPQYADLKDFKKEVEDLQDALQKRGEELYHAIKNSGIPESFGIEV